MNDKKKVVFGRDMDLELMLSNVTTKKTPKRNYFTSVPYNPHDKHVSDEYLKYHFHG